MRLLCVILTAGISASATLAQSQVGQEAEADGYGFVRRAGQLFSALRAFGDWNTHYAYLMDALERTYARNGWDSESDAFSLELIRQVNEIPPWFPQQRFERALEIIGDRYGLTDEQRQRVQELVVRNSWEMFEKYGDRILDYALDAIQTRAAGEPFTPQKVARWVQLAQPVFAESRQRLNAAVESLLPELSEEQRALIEQDLRAANRRLADIERHSVRWAQGQWQAWDWGLEEDPIQLGLSLQPAAEQQAAEFTAGEAQLPSADATQAASLDGAGLPGPGEGPMLSPVPPEILRDPWARYVRQFIAKYRLDDRQQSQAWRIYRDQRQKAERRENRYQEQRERLARLAAGGAGEPAQRLAELEASLRATLDELFSQLKLRLERIPTRAQRRAALQAGAAASQPTAPVRVETGGP